MITRGIGRILVSAGTNGAGKSTIVQPFIQANGGAYFNPDEYTRSLVAAGMSPEDANLAAWTYGYEKLRKAIDEGSVYAFETTLGGQSIAFELMRALAMGCRVDLIYVGLSSPELHIQRVAERVRRGGHDIPEAKIRERYKASLKNLTAFIGTAATIRVFDNSEQTADGRPRPLSVFDIENQRLKLSDDVTPQTVPAWTKALLLRAKDLTKNDF